MKRFSSHPPVPYPEAIAQVDATLAALGAVTPRDGLAQRVLARLETAPALPWHRRLFVLPAGSRRWTAAAASVVVVACLVGVAFTHDRAAAPAPVVARLPHAASQAVSPAAGVAVNGSLRHGGASRTRHRGILRSYRAVHPRAALPRGTQVPARPGLSSPRQQTSN